MKKPKLYNMKTSNINIPTNIILGEYIGRGTPWGNPFILGPDGNRNEVCDSFEKYAIWRFNFQPGWLAFLKGKNLYCHCVPLRCHGETLLGIIERDELDKKILSKLSSPKSKKQNPKKIWAKKGWLCVK